MSPRTPITPDTPGLQYPAELDSNSPIGMAFKNVFDNIFFIRRMLENQTPPNTLTKSEIEALIQSLLRQMGRQRANVIVGTHTERLTTYGAAALSVGVEFFETDRTSTYIISDLSGGRKWVYTAGSMSGLLATRPTDLTTIDSGFLFTDITTDNETQYLWDGAEWLTIGGWLQAITDTVDNAVSTVLVLQHSVAGMGLASMGTGLLSKLKNGSSNLDNASSLNTQIVNNPAATYTTKWFVQLRDLGAALADYFGVLVSGIQFKIGGFWGIFTHANSADRTYTLPNATGNITYQTAALANNNFTFGGGGALVKDAGFAIVPVANGGSNASTAAGARASFNAAQIQAPGGPHTVPLAKITGGGTDGSITFNAEGVITGFVDPT